MTRIFIATPANEAYFGKGAHLVRPLPPDHEHTAHAADRVQRTVEWIATTGLPLAALQRWTPIREAAERMERELTDEIAKLPHPRADINQDVAESVFRAIVDIRTFLKRYGDFTEALTLIERLRVLMTMPEEG